MGKYIRYKRLTKRLKGEKVIMGKMSYVRSKEFEGKPAIIINNSLKNGFDYQVKIGEEKLYVYENEII